MRLHLAIFSLTLGDPEGSNEGHICFGGLFIMNRTR